MMMMEVMIAGSMTTIVTTMKIKEMRKVRVLRIRAELMTRTRRRRIPLQALHQNSAVTILWKVTTLPPSNRMNLASFEARKNPRRVTRGPRLIAPVASMAAVASMDDDRVIALVLRCRSSLMACVLCASRAKTR